MSQKELDEHMRWKRAVCFALTLALGAAAAFLDIGSWQELDVDRIGSAAATTVILDASGREAAGLFAGENRRWTPLGEMPESLRQAFVAAEDARFYSHHGVDLRRIGGALLADLRSGSLAEGASTITQQLVRMTHLSGEKTFSRKAQEAYLALALERRMSKDEILEAYINTAYFGCSAYGAAAAARAYFSREVGEMTLAQCALLAGLVKAPSALSPDAHAEKALARRSYVLSRMAEMGFISEEERAAADAEPLELDMEEIAGTSSAWYVDAAMDEAIRALGIGAEAFLTGGYRVYTALDPALQESAEALFARGELFPASAPDGTKAQAALVAMEPQSGEIAALIGGRSYDTRRGLDRAMDMRRQPGSAFKPVSVYAAAVDGAGYSPCSLVEDEQRDFGGGYSPRNAGGKYFGTVSLRTALSRSLNAASVDLLTRVGVPAAREYAARLGIPLSDADGGLSLALGSLTEGVSPARLCGAYAALANGGTAVEPHCVRRIEDRTGAVVYEWRSAPRRAISEESACLLTSMLESAVQTGSARALSQAGFPIAAKTGTVAMEAVDGNRDAWIAAYTPRLAVCVWMGFDEPDAAHCLPSSTGGSAEPARLACAFFQTNRERADAGAFPLAKGIVSVEVDRRALEQTRLPMLAGLWTPPSQRMTELFREGDAPRVTSNVWSAPRMVWDLSVASEDGAPLVRFTAEAGSGYRVWRESAEGRVLAAEVVAPAAGMVEIRDEGADRASSQSYSVTSFNAELAAEGIDLSGEACLPVVWEPRGALETIWERVLGPTAPPIAAPEEEPLF